MSRYVVDVGVVLHLAKNELDVPPEHELLAPTLLRSQLLSTLHEAVHAGRLGPEDAREQLTRARTIKLRLLGDAVLQRNAWRIADELGWASTYDAEYLALTKLQADGFVTLDKKLARLAAQVVPTATIDDLLR